MTTRGDLRKMGGLTGFCMGQTRKLRCLLLSGVLSVTGCYLLDKTYAPEVGSPPPTHALASPAVPSPVGPELSTPSDLPLTPAVQPDDRPLPINLPTALQLANVQAVDVATAAERIKVAAAVLEQAEVLWLPSITLGGDYNRHDGNNQDTQGNVFDNSRSSMMLGAGTGIGPAAILNVNDAIFAPLVARQQLRRARRISRQRPTIR